MKDVPKIRYLVKEPKRLRLRRNVPVHLRSLAGRTAWVEQVSHGSIAKLKEQANVFACATDAEIRRLTAVSAKPQSSSKTPIGECQRLRLSEAAADQIAHAYFLGAERLRTKSGAYVPRDDNVHTFREQLQNAGLDHRDASRALRQREGEYEEEEGSRTFSRAWSLLVDQGLVVQGPGRRQSPSEDILTDERFQYLCRMLERADAELARRRLSALEEGTHPILQDEFFRPSIQPGASLSVASSQVHSIGDLIASFEARKRNQVGISRMTQFKIPLRALKEEIGAEHLVGSVSRDQCQQLADLFVKLPPYVSQHYAGMSLQKAAEAYRRKNGKHADRPEEAKKALTVLQSIFDHAVHLEWIDKNPVGRVEITREARQRTKYHEQDAGYDAFEIEELQHLFQAPLYTGCKNDEAGVNTPGTAVVKRHRYWAPLIALWTGMRMNEILQLERGDLREADGIRYLAVTDEEEIAYDHLAFEKRVKNRNAIRDIPIHPELHRLGLVDWIESRPAGWLFPEAFQGKADKLSTQFSKRFATFLKSRRLWVPRRKVFHSFRNNFNDALRAGGVSEEFRSTINGWAQEQKMDARYGRGHKVDRLFPEIRKAEYRGLDLSHLHTKSFS
ncbi:site-specific integrase [Aurantimonas sp. A2-1-M11]|uniref:site-specific integrase n=1 Tax=Aurantimonas sp. A2-1-M11 TaxID=3113712 RepID=UPI002F949032